MTSWSPASVWGQWVTSLPSQSAEDNKSLIALKQWSTCKHLRLNAIHVTSWSPASVWGQWVTSLPSQHWGQQITHCPQTVIIMQASQVASNSCLKKTCSATKPTSQDVCSTTRHPVTWLSVTLIGSISSVAQRNIKACRGTTVGKGYFHIQQGGSSWACRKEIPCQELLLRVLWQGIG